MTASWAEGGKNWGWAAYVFWLLLTTPLSVRVEHPRAIPELAVVGSSSDVATLAALIEKIRLMWC